MHIRRDLATATHGLLPKWEQLFSLLSNGPLQRYSRRRLAIWSRYLERLSLTLDTFEPPSFSFEAIEAALFCAFRINLRLRARHHFNYLSLQTPFMKFAARGGDHQFFYIPRNFDL